MSALETLRQADTLLRSGRSDEEVEHLTGATLSEILELRVKLATTTAPILRADRFPGRRWWK